MTVTVTSPLPTRTLPTRTPRDPSPPNHSATDTHIWQEGLARGMNSGDGNKDICLPFNVNMLLLTKAQLGKYGKQDKTRFGSLFFFKIVKV